MKKIFSILTICAAVFASCSKVEINTPGEDGLTVTLKMAGIDTKAVVPMPGVAELNENAVKAINYYIFDGGKLVDSGAQTVADEMTSEGITVKLNGFTEEKFAEVFGADKKSLSIYVVANATSQLSGKTIESVSDIEAVALELATTAKQDSFVMAGNSTIQEIDSDTDTRKATAEVSLKRVVAKISLKIDLATSYQKAEGEPVWTPEKSQISVSFSNLAKNGVIAGMADDVVLVNADVKNFTAAAEVEGYYPCTTAEPYYSYPRTWALGDETQPYFLINIPWTANGETKQTYYKVILSNKSFASNNWYAIDVKLDGLGSLTPGEPVVVEPLDLTVADWTASVSGTYEYHTEASFTEARVLDIPQESVTLFNQNGASFEFYSSHDCEIVSVVLTTYNYAVAGQVVPKIETLPVDKYPFSLDNSKTKRLNFNHQLNNDISSDSFDYQAYTYKVTVKHKDNENFTDELTVVQRPALTITAHLNSAGNGDGKNYNNYVDGIHEAGSEYNNHYGGTVDKLGSGSNNNPNMFVISASVLTSDMQIGDPRSNTPESWEGSNTFEDVKGNKRHLENYYRTDTNKGNVVAPEFRIASSWGKTYTLSYEDAVHRCSSYQEDGYPAGRWRLPTEAEVRFMMRLSGMQYIDVLFSDNNYYWCNTCRIKINGEEIETSTATAKTAVRCVYDEWYWKESQYSTVSSNTPRWGDMKREDFE